jgi:hypothetical protein
MKHYKPRTNEDCQDLNNAGSAPSLSAFFLAKVQCCFSFRVLSFSFFDLIRFHPRSSAAALKKLRASNQPRLKALNGRDAEIRTRDLTHPKGARYQAAPRPAKPALSISAKIF